MPRKEKKYHFIYKTTNLLTGKYYIGMHSTDDLEDGYLGSGKRLRYSIRKYGEQNHQREIVEFVDTREELKSREKEIVSLDEIAKENCMNLMEGGQGGFISEEQQLRRAKAASKAAIEKRRNDPEARRKHSDNSSKNMKKLHEEGKIRYDTFIGKSHSEETKKKISKAKKGQYLGENSSQFGTCWVTNGKEVKKINKSELNTYIDRGFKRGRK